MDSSAPDYYYSYRYYPYSYGYGPQESLERDTKNRLPTVRSPPRTKTIPTNSEEAALRYLITGGAGFIGSHLAERLLEKNDKVVLLDNLSTGSMENIRHLKGSENLEYHLDGIENQTAPCGTRR